MGDVAPGSSAALRVTVLVAAAGTQTVSSEVAGLDQLDPDPSDDASTVQVSVAVQPGDAVGPRITQVDRFGLDRTPTAYVLTFDKALDSARASDLGNYRLVDPGRDGRFGTRDDRTIRIRSALYNPADRTVTITPATRIAGWRRVQLTVVGTGAAALTDVAGNRLDGDADGRPGGDHEVTLRGFARGRGQGFDLRPLDIDGDGRVTPRDIRLIRGRQTPPLAALAARSLPAFRPR